jgi:DNA-directed RNA polymerase I, II, and III subunit RPABC5
MIIPIRCVTCGKVLADKWLAYEKAVKEHLAEEKGPQKEKEKERKKVKDKQLHENFSNPFRGEIMDSLGLTKLCCRRHMLGHVDLMDVI